MSDLAGGVLVLVLACMAVPLGLVPAIREARARRRDAQRAAREALEQYERARRRWEG